MEEAMPYGLLLIPLIILVPVVLLGTLPVILADRRFRIAMGLPANQALLIKLRKEILLLEDKKRDIYNQVRNILVEDAGFIQDSTVRNRAIELAKGAHYVKKYLME